MTFSIVLISQWRNDQNEMTKHKIDLVSLHLKMANSLTKTPNVALMSKLKMPYIIVTFHQHVRHFNWKIQNHVWTSINEHFKCCIQVTFFNISNGRVGEYYLYSRIQTSLLKNINRPKRDLYKVHLQSRLIILFRLTFIFECDLSSYRFIPCIPQQPALMHNLLNCGTLNLCNRPASSVKANFFFIKFKVLPPFFTFSTCLWVEDITTSFVISVQMKFICIGVEFRPCIIFKFDA